MLQVLTCPGAAGIDLKFMLEHSRALPGAFSALICSTCWSSDLSRSALMQIRTNAPDAHMILVITPVNVQSPIRGHTSAQMAARERARQIQDLQAQGFQRLYLLELPPSVMQVCRALSPFNIPVILICIGH